MEDNQDDDGILLNLSQSLDDVHVKKKFTEEKDKAQEKHRKKSTKTRSFKSKRTFTENKKNKQSDSKSANETPTEEDINKKSCQFTSSLFTKNPEIPEISTVKAQKIESDELFVKDHKCENQISDRLVKTLKDQFGFRYFTKVQELSIPIILSGKDVLIKSPTGSGKTLAYALPIIHKLQSLIPKINRNDGPFAIILLPTRELALQSFEIFQCLCRAFVWIVPGLIVGGEKRKSEKSRIRKGMNIVVATPGRLLDHLKTTKCLSSRNVSFVIFDEADRLLDLGFQESIISILNIVKEESKNQQTVLLSATLNPKVENLASISLKIPTCIDATKEIKEVIMTGKPTSNDSNSQISKLDIPNSLKQYFAIVPAKLRLVSLLSFLRHSLADDHGKLIIFFSSKSSTEFHFSVLDNQLIKVLCVPIGCNIYKLHGDMQQKSRNDVFQQFKKCHQGILLCTDVAARGLDLPHVSWIIQYSCPVQVDEYVHRVGRTARIGTEGKSLLFLLPSEARYIELLREKNVAMDEMKLFEMLAYLLPVSAKRRNQNIIEGAATDLQNKLEETIQSCPDLNTLAEKAFRSYIQSYATYPTSLKNIFHLKKIHLGHIAKSFALRKAPRQMEKWACQERVAKRTDPKDRKKSGKRKMVNVREDGAGLVLQGPRPGKRKKLQLEKKRK